MPGFDGTGPRGQGPMTGGGFGNCAGAGAGYAGSRGGFGRGQRCGRGFGPGRGGGRFAAYPQAPAIDEKANLEARLGWLEQEATRIRERLSGQES